MIQQMVRCCWAEAARCQYQIYIKFNQIQTPEFRFKQKGTETNQLLSLSLSVQWWKFKFNCIVLLAQTMVMMVSVARLRYVCPGTSAANRLIGEVVQSWRRPLLGPPPS